MRWLGWMKVFVSPDIVWRKKKKKKKKKEKKKRRKKNDKKEKKCRSLGGWERKPF